MTMHHWGNTGICLRCGVLHEHVDDRIASASCPGPFEKPKWCTIHVWLSSHEQTISVGFDSKENADRGWENIYKGQIVRDWNGDQFCFRAEAINAMQLHVIDR